MPPTLDPEELSALMGAVREGTVAPAARVPRSPVVPWDLTSRDRIIRGQMPTLDAINERVASMFASGLAGRTRVNLRITSSPATLLKFADGKQLVPVTPDMRESDDGPVFFLPPTIENTW